MATGKQVLGREEPERVLTIGSLLIPNPEGARVGSARASITPITSPRPASAVDGTEALEVARASRPLWHGHLARALLRLLLALGRPVFPGVEEDFRAAGAGRSRHSGRDARATNFSPPSAGEAKAFNVYVPQPCPNPLITFRPDSPAARRDRVDKGGA